MRLLPDVGPQRLVARLAREYPIEHVLHVDEDVEIIAVRTAHERHEIGGTVPRGHAADEHPVFSAERHLLHELLGLVVVDRHEAVVEIFEHVIELVPEIRDRLPEGFFGHHVRHGVAGDQLAQSLPGNGASHKI